MELPDDLNEFDKEVITEGHSYRLEIEEIETGEETAIRKIQQKYSGELDGQQWNELGTILKVKNACKALKVPFDINLNDSVKNIHIAVSVDIHKALFVVKSVSPKDIDNAKISVEQWNKLNDEIKSQIDVTVYENGQLSGALDGLKLKALAGIHVASFVNMQKMILEEEKFFTLSTGWDVDDYRKRKKITNEAEVNQKRKFGETSKNISKENEEVESKRQKLPQDLQPIRVQFYKGNPDKVEKILADKKNGTEPPNYSNIDVKQIQLGTQSFVQDNSANGKQTIGLSANEMLDRSIKLGTRISSQCLTANVKTAIIASELNLKAKPVDLPDIIMEKFKPQKYQPPTFNNDYIAFGPSEDKFMNEAWMLLIKEAIDIYNEFGKTIKGLHIPVFVKVYGIYRNDKDAIVHDFHGTKYVELNCNIDGGSDTAVLDDITSQCYVFKSLGEQMVKINTITGSEIKNHKKQEIHILGKDNISYRCVTLDVKRVGQEKFDGSALVKLIGAKHGLDDNVVEYMLEGQGRTTKKVHLLLGLQSLQMFNDNICAEQLGGIHHPALPNIGIYRSPITKQFGVCGTAGVNPQLVDEFGPALFVHKSQLTHLYNQVVKANQDKRKHVSKQVKNTTLVQAITADGNIINAVASLEEDEDNPQTVAGASTDSP
jgi:hypothetical protein